MNLNPLSWVIPPWVKPLLIALSYVVVAGGSAYVAWELKANAELKQEVFLLKKEVKTEIAQNVVSNTVAAKTLKAKAAVDDTFKTRADEVQSYDNDRAAAGQAPIYPPAADASGGLVIPMRLACMWRSANQSQLPGPECLADGRPSGIGLGDIETQHDREAAITEKLRKDYLGLELWVCEQYLLRNGVPLDYEVCKLKEP